VICTELSLKSLQGAELSAMQNGIFVRHRLRLLDTLRREREIGLRYMAHLFVVNYPFIDFHQSWHEHVNQHAHESYWSRIL